MAKYNYLRSDGESVESNEAGLQHYLDVGDGVVFYFTEETALNCAKLNYNKFWRDMNGQPYQYTTGTLTLS